MASSRSRKIKWSSVLLWWVLLAAAVCGLPVLLQSADAWLYSRAGQLLGLWSQETVPQLVQPGKAVQMEKVEVRERSRECPAVGMVGLNHAAAAEAFAALPLGPQDMAVLLNKLAQGGVESVSVSASFMWKDGVGAMGKEMLCHVLASFPHSAVGLRGRTAAQADFTPIVLRDAAIPAENVEGDCSKLPMANRPLPNGLTETPDSLNITWAPDWLQDEPMTQRPSAVEDMSFPLLVRWNGETIPTLPFRLALAHLGLSAADVKVVVGREISYGGFTLPLDEYGRTRLSEAQVAELPLADVLAGKTAGSGIRLVMLEQPQEEKGALLRLERLARTLSQMAGREKVTVHTELHPVGGKALLCAVPMPDWRSLRVWCYLLGGAAAALLALRFVPLFPVFFIRLLVTVPAVWVLWQAYVLLVRSSVWLPVASVPVLWLLLMVSLRSLRPVKQGRGSRR